MHLNTFIWISCTEFYLVGEQWALVQPRECSWWLVLLKIVVWSIETWWGLHQVCELSTLSTEYRTLWQVQHVTLFPVSNLMPGEDIVIVLMYQRLPVLYCIWSRRNCSMWEQTCDYNPLTQAQNPPWVLNLTAAEFCIVQFQKLV